MRKNMMKVAGSLVVVVCSLTLEATPTTRTQEVRIGTAPAIPNGVVTPPRVVSYRAPEYTAAALSAEIDGVVLVEAAFDTDGNPKILRVVQGLGYGLDENALAAIATWRFAPAARNGVRVSSVAQIEVRFRRSVVHDQMRDLHRTLEELQSLRRDIEARVESVHENSNFGK